MRVRLLAFIVVALLLGTGAADAATWKRVTATGGGSIDQVALLRTSNGVLHVVWPRRAGPSTEDLLHTAISANGALGATTPIVSGWAELQNAALVLDSAGIRVFFGGIRTTAPSETNDELSTALSGNGGGTWFLQEGNVVPDGGQAYGSPVAAVALPSGPLEAWAGTLGTWVHQGVVPVTPNYDFQAPLGNHGYDPGIAASPSGQAFLAWYSNATGHLGVYTQGVAADGSPIGAAARMPGTGNMAVGMIGRTPIVARVGGGFYVVYATGYPSLNRIRLWRGDGSGSTQLVATTKNNSTATIAAAPDGRLWIAWTKTVGGKPHVFARRSNRSAGVFGAVVDVGRPAHASSMYRLDGSSTTKALDVFVNASIGITSTTSTLMRRTFPGLTLKSSRARLPRGVATSVTFTVLDAGDPVRGARVSARGDSGSTNAQGKVTLRVVGTGRSLKATASRSQYVSASRSLRVR